MSSRVTQVSYNAGVLSGLMEGRADDNKYQAGLAVCRNAMCTPQGPVRNRSGFMYVNYTKYPDKPTRIIPFTYSADQTMIIELGDKYARFHTQGKTLLNTGASAATLAEGDVPYEIATPWAAEDLFSLHYVQNAETMTITHPNYVPQEIRRYSLTDWRISACNFIATLQPPENVRATRITEASNDDNKDKYTQKYVVTALNKDRTEESEKSAEASVKANLYATGTTVEVTWDEVDGASFYRVYKLQGGIYGYIGETESTSIIDDNIAPETGVTPPYQDEAFGTTRGITSVTVLDGGSGYEAYTSGIKYNGGLPDWSASRRGFGTYKVNKSEGGYPSYPSPPYDEIRKNVDVVDAAGGAGSGAVIDMEFVTANTRHKSTAPHDGDPDRYYSYTYAFIKSIIVKIPGENYQKPRLRIKRPYYGGDGLSYYEGYYSSSNWANKDDSYYYLDLGTVSKTVQLNVSDATGTGAELKANVEGGRIVKVIVVRQGHDYTSPTVSVISSSGSGASFSCEIGKGMDNPAAVGYFEQRRVFAGSNIKPQRIWMSATGTDSNFTYHLPLQDEDRISFDIASRDLNQIKHVVALQQLLMLTSAAEWRVSPLNSDAITPTSISVRPQSYVGASDTQPILANSTAIYVAARGGHVREISYDYNAGGYITGDLSLRANELFDGMAVTDLAYSKEPFPVVWAISSSGSMLGLTYVPEQQVGAWFELTTQGSFESVAVVQEGSEDAVYCVVSRNLGGRIVKTVERMATGNTVVEKDGMYLDMSGRYEGDPTTTLSGLYWLAGNRVSINADGVVYEDVQVPDDGALVLPKAASRITVGLPYSIELQTMPVILGLSDGSLGKGRVKDINRVWLRLKTSAAPEVGSSFDSMQQQKTRTNEVPGTPPDLIDGVIEAIPPGKWEQDSSICIRVSKPLPFILISHAADVAVGG